MSTALEAATALAQAPFILFLLALTAGAVMTVHALDPGECATGHYFRRHPSGVWACTRRRCTARRDTQGQPL